MPRRFSLWFVISIVVAFSLLLAACGPTATTAAPVPTKPAEPTKPPEPTKPAATATKPPEPTKAPTTFRIAWNVDIATFDPHGNTNIPVANVVEYMAETLITTDKDGKLTPLLAKSWETSKDGLEITFKLQENVKFSDGTAFDAEAVKFNVGRILDTTVTVPGRAAYLPIKEAVVVDPLTVKFKLEKPNGALLPSMAFTNIAMLSPKSLPKDSEDYKALKLKAPTGTGPYTLKEYVKAERIVLARNPNYWGKKPYYDEVVFRIVPDAATRESLILAGQVDLTVLVPITDLPTLQKNADVKVVTAKSTRLIFIALNTTHKPLDNPKVRQALNYAVNKEEIVKNLMLGYGTPVDSPMPQGFFGYCKTGPYEYNPDKAKQLLKEANVPAGTKLKFMATTGRYIQDFQIAQAIGGYLKEVGIDAEPTTTDYSTYIGLVLKPQAEATLDMHMLGWASSHTYGSHTMEMFDSNNHPPKGFAATYYKNTEVDKLIQTALSEPDPTKSAEAFCNANKLIWADAPWIFLHTQPFIYVQSAKVTGISSDPSEKIKAIYAEPVK